MGAGGGGWATPSPPHFNHWYSLGTRGAGRVPGQGGQNSAQSAEKIFRLPTLVFSLPTLPYVTVAHPAHRTEADLREKASLATNHEAPSPPSDLALQLGLVIHRPGLWLQENK